MPIPSELFPFTSRLLAGAPEEPGIYVLWEAGEAIFIGHGVTIRACLIDHFAAPRTPCTARATHYSWEISRRPADREAELLATFRALHGRLPRCHAA